MTYLHRNSQKRIYCDNFPVFITANTYNRYPYFDEDILCELLVAEINLAQKLKGFEIIAYKINPDHFHLLILPTQEYNYSNIMHFIRRHTSKNANIIIKARLAKRTYGDGNDDDAQARLDNRAYGNGNDDDDDVQARPVEGDNRASGDENDVQARLAKRACGDNRAYGDDVIFIENIMSQFVSQFQAKYPDNLFPQFQWQKSFHNWLLGTEKEVFDRIKYIARQARHHNLPENKYLFVSEDYGGTAYWMDQNKDEEIK